MLFPKGIAIFFITIIVGAEAVHSHDQIKAHAQYQRLTRSERASSMKAAQHELAALEAELGEAEAVELSGPEKDWQAANNQCVADERSPGGCTCKGDSCDKLMCGKRPLPNDKSEDEKCRLTEEYMMQGHHVVKFLDIQNGVLAAKALKYKRNCDSWWYTRSWTFGHICARRAGQMVFAVQFITKALDDERVQALDAATRGKMGKKYESARDVLTDALGQAGDTAAVQKLAADVKASGLMETHPQVATQRIMGAIKMLIQGTPEEQAEARAFIASGDVGILPTAEELDLEEGGVEREMTPEEVAAEKQRMKDTVDSEATAAVAGLTDPELVSSSLLEAGELRAGGATEIALQVIGVAVLITLFVVGIIATAVWLAGIIGTWLVAVTLGCTAYQVGRADERAELAAASTSAVELTGAEVRRSTGAPRGGLVEVEAGGLVEASTAAAAIPNFGKIGLCVIKWFALPFVLIGTAIVWVWRKATGTPSERRSRDK